MERVSRRNFIGYGASLCGAAVLPDVVCSAEDDWKAAFRLKGFDPDQPGSSVFVVTSDIHAQMRKPDFDSGDDYHRNLASHVAFWNAMQPRPEFVAALGDFGSINRHFGERPSAEKVKARAKIQFGTINKILTDGLRDDISRVYVVGNHDTYPGEDDRATWREYFQDQPPYCAFDACGIRFIKWDGGVDGMIGDAQEKWIEEECAKCPKDRQLVILVHQPAIGPGFTGMERGIGRVAKAVLADRPGVTWLLGGHEHRNDFSVWSLKGGGMLSVATHTMDQFGWWAYGVRDGRIVARIFCDEKNRGFSPKKMPGDMTSSGEIPVAWQGRTDVLWNTFVGTSEEKACRMRLENTCDNCTFLFYVGTTVHRFQKETLAPKATKYAILGRCPGHRKTRVPAKCYMACDGKKWIETACTAAKNGEFEFPIPPSLVSAETLWVKYVGFGFAADECHAGYAFLK